MTASCLVALLISASPDASLESAHASFMKLHLVRVSTSDLAMMKQKFESLDVQWQEYGRSAAPTDAVTALVRQGELRWHFADEFERAPTPQPIRRLGEEAIVTFRDSIAENVVALRKEARTKWTQAEALAARHGIEPASLVAVRRYIGK